MTSTAGEFYQFIEFDGGAEGNRTPDLYNAIVALSQLSYGPISKCLSGKTDWAI